MDTGLLSLKWNNHSSTFFHVLETIRKKELYSDVTIACDGKFFSVHKLVLSTCSEYFQEMFERTQCKHPIIVLKDINHKDLESLLNYMYIGEVNVIQTELSSLIKAAECLKVKGLAVPDEPPSTNRKAGKRPNVPDRDRDEGIVYKRNRRNTPVNAMPDQMQNTSEERTPLNNMSPSPNMSVDSDRDNIEREKRLHAEDHQSSTHNFKEFEPVLVKTEKEDSAPDNFVQEELPELPPVSKFEFHGSPVDSTISSGLDEGNESSYGAHLQQPHSEESMGHLIPSTSRYGESSNWPSEMDNLDKGDKEGGGGGEAGNYDPNPNAFLLDNSQGKAQMAPFSGGFPSSKALEYGADIAHPYMKKEGKMWKCVYPQCSYEAYKKTTISTHVRKHTGEKPFACYLCDYRSNQSSNLYQHFKRKHNYEQNPYSELPRVDLSQEANIT